MTDDLEIELISVETNYRTTFSHRNNGGNWSCEHGAVIPGILEFFSKTYATTLVANSGNAAHYVHAWADHPVSHRYLTSTTCELISDGVVHSRTERAGFIKEWKVGIENLRVCFSCKNESKNCGFCEKCVRTKLNFFVNNVTHLPSMPWDLSPKDLRQILKISSEHVLADYKDLLDYGRKHGTLNTEMENILKTRIKFWMEKAGHVHHKVSRKTHRKIRRKAKKLDL